MKSNPDFWSKISEKYAASPISDIGAYEATMDRVLVHLPKDARVLELGCGTGSTALRLAPHVHSIVATDFADGMIAQAKAKPGADNAQFLCADAFDPALEDGVFDVVMGFNLFHLVEDTPAVMGRIHDLLVPGGLFISKSVCLGERSLGLKFGLMKRLIPVLQWVGKAPFVRFETIAGLEADIVASGFEIIETGDYPARPPSHFVVAKRV
ncbi:class I SAM-dependent methyltransferase [uncultured Tateyamaria sp.]|uniref:class I SAM-dependent methyltransferase n=1 Tax=uncultured Tateyamaria sp. TaxID=455651 RepID=UPI002605F4D1|nr:class I SAM-dependent methyltransferase [uncultured Tateyamaria sp.]